MKRIYRRIIQCFFFLLMIVVPILNLLDIYFIKGTYISLDVGALAISDPLAVLQALFASHEVKAIMIVSVTIPILVALLLGRIWCSWACPYYLITDGIDFLRKKLKLKNRKPVYVTSAPTKANFFRFSILICGLIITSIAGVPLLYLISPPSVLSAEFIMIIKHFTLTAEFILIPIILILDFFYYRFWCRFFCPTGTCLSLFKNKKTMGVEYLGTCSGCNKCVQVCPMVLDPKKDGRNIACNNCGECVISCPDNKKTETLTFKIK